MFGTILFGGVIYAGNSGIPLTGDIWDVKCEPTEDEWTDKYTPSSAKVDICEVE